MIKETEQFKLFCLISLFFVSDYHFQSPKDYNTWIYENGVINGGSFGDTIIAGIFAEHPAVNGDPNVGSVALIVIIGGMVLATGCIIAEAA